MEIIGFFPDRSVGLGREPAHVQLLSTSKPSIGRLVAGSFGASTRPEHQILVALLSCQWRGRKYIEIEDSDWPRSRIRYYSPTSVTPSQDGTAHRAMIDVYIKPQAGAPPLGFQVWIGLGIHVGNNSTSFGVWGITKDCISSHEDPPILAEQIGLWGRFDLADVATLPHHYIVDRKKLRG